MHICISASSTPHLALKHRSTSWLSTRFQQSSQTRQEVSSFSRLCPLHSRPDLWDRCDMFALPAAVMDDSAPWLALLDGVSIWTLATSHQLTVTSSPRPRDAASYQETEFQTYTNSLGSIETEERCALDTDAKLHFPTKNSNKWFFLPFSSPTSLSHLTGSVLFSRLTVEAQKVCARRTLRRYTHGVADAGIFGPGTQTFDGGSVHRTEQHAARSYTQLILQHFQGGHSRTETNRSSSLRTRWRLMKLSATTWMLTGRETSLPLSGKAVLPRQRVSAPRGARSRGWLFGR